MSLEASDVYDIGKIFEAKLMTVTTITKPTARFIPAVIQNFDFSRPFGELYEVGVLQLVQTNETDSVVVIGLVSVDDNDNMMTMWKLLEA